MVISPWIMKVVNSNPEVDFELLSIIHLFEKMNKPIWFSKLCKVLDGKTVEGYDNMYSDTSKEKYSLRDYIGMKSEVADYMGLLKYSWEDIDNSMTYVYHLDKETSWGIGMFAAIQLTDENSLVSVVAAEQFGKDAFAEGGQAPV